MRSNEIHRALAQGKNRFEVCQLVSKGVKATHKTGSRFEDSINDVLHRLGGAVHVAAIPAVVPPAKV
jgi:hypothetical protein